MGERNKMDYRILGPLEVSDGERPVRLGGDKQRALLAILLLHRNEFVPADRLIEDLWGGSPPASSLRTLHAYVSRLRKALNGNGASHAGGEGSGPEGAHGVLLTSRHGYLLQLAPGELDLERFQELTVRGRDALAAGRPKEAVRLLREALALWRGPPLADFAYEAFAQAEIARLEELRATAFEQLIEAELALGREVQVLGDLERLVSEHPYRERLRGQLIRALYRTGRQADALAAYQAARRTLVQDLGIEPSAELRELEEGILRHDPSLLRPAPVAPPPAGHLPVPATSFLGRAREVAEVTALLQRKEGRLLTLTGAGGIGKTRLALRVAHEYAREHQDGAWFVGFADITDPGLIAPAVCQALGLADQPELTPVRRLEEYLRDRELLLVLDNLEQLAPGTSVLGELLAACPGVRMLVTSREPLHLAGEQQYEVPVLESGDAIDLFTVRARAVVPILSAERASVDAVCERLDRLPLAIELAAARTKMLSPAEILDRLERRLPATAAGPRDVPQRQRTLDATIDWSYNLLNIEEQRQFVRLSVFPGGWTLASAQTVCDADLDTLASLVDRSLIRRDASRYSMLMTLREYALERLEQSGEADGLRQAHADWLVELLEAEHLPWPGWPDAKSLERLAPEQENFTAALEWASRTGRSELLARLAAPLVGVWLTQGRVPEANRWIKLVLEHEASYSRLLTAQVLSAAAITARHRGDHGEASALARKALKHWREIRDMRAIGLTLKELRGPSVEKTARDAASERTALERAIQFARDNALSDVLADTLASLADLVICTGNLSEARALCEESRATAGPGSFGGVIAALNLAYIETAEGHPDEAERLTREALQSALERRDRLRVAWGVIIMAWPRAEQGQFASAARLLGAGLGFLNTAGVSRQWMDRACESAVRGILGDQLDANEVETLFSDGRSRTVEQVAGEALSEPSTER